MTNNERENKIACLETRILCIKNSIHSALGNHPYDVSVDLEWLCIQIIRLQNEFDQFVKTFVD